MKLYFISESRELKKALEYHFTPLGFEIEFEENPLTLIDNIDDLDFDAILFDAASYPRHWKPMIRLLREYKSKEKAVVILTNKEGFPFEEASKAIFLEINGLIAEDLSPKQLIYRLEEILRRYKNLPDSRKFARLLVTDEEPVAFLFTHPKKTLLVFGEVMDISIQGMNFMPYNMEICDDLYPGDVIENSTLRVGEDIININCSIIRNKGSLGIMFDALDENDHHKLFEYLITKPERELRSEMDKGKPPVSGE